VVTANKAMAVHGRTVAAAEERGVALAFEAAVLAASGDQGAARGLGRQPISRIAGIWAPAATS
jgi:homoserine dehydrogenase